MRQLDKLIHEAQEAHRPLALFMDYDGTLVNIEKISSLTFPPPFLKNLLGQLFNTQGIFAALVTGRSLDDIEKLTGLHQGPIVANHGFQIRYHGFKWSHPDAVRCRPVLHKTSLALQDALGLLSGILLEDKMFTLTVHYRNASSQHALQAKKKIYAVLRQAGAFLRMTEGKKTFNILPNVEWNKGKGVLKILQEAKIEGDPLMVYIGDDQTDEDAFKELRSKGVMIRVGRKAKTYARYFLSNPEEVREFLKRCVGGGKNS